MKIIRIKHAATIAFICPNKRRSGARINSIVFIVAMITICVTAQRREFILLRIHIAIIISNMPIVFVAIHEYSWPSIRATINW